MKLDRLMNVCAVLVFGGIASVSSAQNPACSASAQKNCTGQTSNMPVSIPGSFVGFSRNIAGTLTNSVLGLSGCAQTICVTNQSIAVTCSNLYTTVRVCTTNQVPQLTNCSTTWVTSVCWQTNFTPVSVCMTNPTTRVITCTNKSVAVVSCRTNQAVQRVRCQTNLVTVVQCQSNSIRQTLYVTNTVTRVTCTNNYNGAALFHMNQKLSGPIAPNAGCDELATYLPSTATFSAVFSTAVRQPDWRGYHTGTFTIAAGTNVFATGDLYGVSGIDSHGAVEPCAPCGHFEGALHGVLTKATALPGAQIKATYAADIGGLTKCASNAPPQGPVTMYLDGVVVTTNCIAFNNSNSNTITNSGPCGSCLNTFQLDFDWSATVSDQGGVCGATGTYTNHCSLSIARTGGCTWSSASNPSSGLVNGIQFITGAEVYPDIDMGDGTYYFGVTIGTYCLMIPNTDLVTPSACPSGAYQPAQVTGCSDGGCVYSFSVSNITIH